MITLRQFVLGSGMIATPTPLILRSTITQNYSQSSPPPIPPFERSLQEHCEKILASGRSRELIVQLEVKFEGICPATHERTVLRVADELVSNAIEHGFSGRQRGHVFVHVVSRAGVGVRVSVNDDRCGFDSGPITDGNGFHLLRQIGDLYAGAAVEAPFAANTAIIVVIPS